MKLICLLFLASIVASCNKDPEYYTLETPADQMLLRTSSADLTLEKEKENETAITFTWNAAAQRGGADANIAYFFRMYMADLHSNVTSLYEIEAGERSISFTHNELNDILASWSILPGDKVTIEAEVIAQVNSSAQYLKPELSKTQFDVVGYDKNATAIYMVMITEDGERSMRRMTEKVVGSGIYQSQAELKPCKYFFALSAESDYPCYMKGENGEKGPLIVLFFSAFSCLVTLPYLLFFYQPMTWQQLLFLLLAGIAGAGGQFAITAAYTYAPARDISVYDYTQVIFSAVLGFFLFHQLPDHYSVIGYVLICGMGVYMFWMTRRAVKNGQEG